MKQILTVFCVIGLVGCGQKRPQQEIPPCKYSSKWNESRCGVSLYQDPDTKIVFSQPGQIYKVKTRKDLNITLTTQDGCFLLPKGATFRKNDGLLGFGQCGFEIQDDGTISPEGTLINDGLVP